MMLSFLLGALVAAAVCQPTAGRFIAAVVFVSVSWAHEFLFSHIEGFAYHGTAAIGALMVIIITGRITESSPTIINLHRVCIASILLNFVGWIAWRAYLPPEPYNVAMLIVFIWALIALNRKDSADVGGDSVGGWCLNFRFHPVASFQPLPINGSKT